MSKHEKQLKRQRRKAERRRSSAAKHGAAALAAAAAIATGTSAYADPIRYDNPTGSGHFDWGDVVLGPNFNLDVMLPADDQPGSLSSPSTVHQKISPMPTNIGMASAGIQVIGAYSDTLGLDAGTFIPTDGTFWNVQGYVYYPGYGSEIPESQQAYVGIRFDLGGGWQYGWIGVVRTGAELDAFAWGYETGVGVPIAAGVPEPGTLAMLAVGAVGVLRRRR